MMAKVHKRTSLVASTVKRLCNGRQQQAYLEKEWHIKLQSDSVKSQREVALQAKLKTTNTDNGKLMKENAALKKSTDTLKGRVTCLADQVQKAQNSGHQPSRGRSQNKSPSKYTQRYRRALKRKRVDRCNNSLAWLEAEGYSATKVVLQNKKTGEVETISLDKECLLQYVKGVSEKIECLCRHLGVKPVFKSHHTLRQSLMRVKNPRPEDLKKGVVYTVPCMDCEKVYIGETGRCLQKRLKEHQYAVRVGDTLNGIAVHAQTHQHDVNWDSAKVLASEENYWKRRTLEAIHIKNHGSTSNLECGLHLSPIWHKLLLAHP